MINIKKLDQNKIKIEEKLYKSIFICYFRHDTTNSVKLSFLIINKIIGYIKEINENKYLTLISADESKDTLKKYEEL